MMMARPACAAGILTAAQSPDERQIVMAPRYPKRCNSVFPVCRRQLGPLLEIFWHPGKRKEGDGEGGRGFHPIPPFKQPSSCARHLGALFPTCAQLGYRCRCPQADPTIEMFSACPSSPVGKGSLPELFGGCMEI